MISNTSRRAFSLMELLVVLAIVGVLVALGLGAGAKSFSQAEKTDSLARLRTVGQAILLYAGEHDQQLPGPLWPGQVMLYDAAREGRIVRDLATYLGVEHKETPYLVQKMIPRAYLRNTTSGTMEDVRVYVMNSVIIQEGQTNRPFGSLTVSPVVESMRLPRLDSLPQDERWMISETDQSHPDVVGAPWRANTPPKPAHDGFRAVLNFDGSANLEQVTD